MDDFVLSRAQFDSLADGFGSPDAVDLLVESQHARRRLLLLAAVERHAALTAPFDVLCDLDQRAPAAGRRVFGHPYLAAWFADLTGGHEARAAEHLGGLVASAAIRTGAPFDLEIPVAGRGLLLPGLGTVPDAGPGTVRASGDGTGWTIDGHRPRWRPLPAIELPADGALRTITLDDADPYRFRFSRPPALLREDTIQRYGQCGAAAWRILVDEQPVHAAAIGAESGPAGARAEIEPSVTDRIQ